MHNNSNLYALDSDTGHKIWQFDCGHDVQYYGLSKDESLITFMKRINKEFTTVYKMQTFRTKTGQVVWEKTLDNEPEVSSYAVSNNVITAVQYEQIGSTEQYNNVLVGWSIETGKELWRIDLVAPTNIVGGTQDVLLVQSGADMSPILLKELYAYDPRTARLLWKKPARQAATGGELTSSMRYEGNENVFWTRSVDELILINAMTGEDRLRLPLIGNKFYDIIDERYAFLKQSIDDNMFSATVNSSLI